MKSVMLFRHGESLMDFINSKDHDRPLTDNGINEARSILEHTLSKPITPISFSESQRVKTLKSSISSENIEETTAH